MRESTLCYLLREGDSGDEVCLAEKQNKYVAGKLNAAGGKLEPGETPPQTALRELAEEQRVMVTEGQLVLGAVIHFVFPGREHEDLRCHVFIARTWEGNPQETSEMGNPQWFPLNNLPLDRLPQSDALWLQRVLQGEYLEITFQHDGEYNLLGHNLTAS